MKLQKNINNKMMLEEKISLLKPFINKWVAFSENKKEIIASGKNIKDVEKKLEKDNRKASFIQFILPFDSHYSPYVYKKSNYANI